MPNGEYEPILKRKGLGMKWGDGEHYGYKTNEMTIDEFIEGRYCVDKGMQIDFC